VDAGWKTSEELYGSFRPHEYTVGEEEQLIPLGSIDGTPETFFLRYRSEHAYFWFESGVQVDSQALEAAARYFEEHIWPLNTAIFGEAGNPGIDGDSRLHIVNQAFIEWGIMGAFNPEDLCPRVVCPESNQREIIYIGLDAAPVNSPEYLTTLAHEHQHLIQHYTDGNESRWVNEGLSQLAEHFNGFDPHYIGNENMQDFLQNPDHQLNAWATDSYELGSSYGASYLFALYLYERFGLDYIRYWAHDPYDGLAGVQHSLAATSQHANVDEVFRDWILANYLDDPYVGDGRYYYQTLDLPSHIQPISLNDLEAGAPYTDTVNQYGADYLSFSNPGAYHITFDGSDQTSILGAKPHSGQWMWWSYNGIDSAARLTGAFDLTGLSAATLRFNAWWDIEPDYDWFQVLVSDNGGKNWQIVSGDSALPQNSQTPGPYYSRKSDGWIEEQIDLSAYAGKPLLIRFEYLTDGSENGPGLVLDDIRIPELGYLDDVENPVSVWNAEGFLRIPETVAQHWSVAVVQRKETGPAAVQFIPLDALNIGRATLVVPEGGSTILVIGAMAPFTSTPARYKLTAQPGG
jgi:immune inhibitor A